jgi:caa(3)-type oxidase subunit IV
MHDGTSYRTYWIAWGILLVLTFIMLIMEAARLPAAVALVVLCTAMFIKATVIGGWFMHLRTEARILVVVLVASTLITAAFMFFLLIPDALDTLHAGPH